MNELLSSLPGARGARGPHALLSLTLAVALAACGGGSGGKKSDGGPGQGGGAGGGGGGSGGSPGGGLGGSPGGGAGSGSAATDASVPSGAGGASGGGTGGAGGSTPSPCSDPKFPVSCAARGDVPAICWSPGTNCSTIAKCGDQFFSCTTPNAHYDCKEMRCVFDNPSGDGGVECGDPNFPVSCPAIGDVPKLCWSSGTVCSTLVKCGTEFKSCLAAGYRYDCATAKCVQGSATPPDAGSGQAPDAGTVDSASGTVDSAAGDTAPATTDAAADATAG